MPITPPVGWALGPWGTGSWALPNLSPGGSLPTGSDGDIYCIEDPAIEDLLTHPEVTYTGGPDDIFVDTGTGMIALASGGAYDLTTARLKYTTTVPLTFTFTAEVYLDNLPNNFSDLQAAHCFLGVSDQQGASAGLFLSKAGIVYTGAVHFVGDDVVLDNPNQLLPDSASIISEGEFYTLRLAVSYPNQVVYIFWTKSDDIPTTGHQLRYVMPMLPSSSAFVQPPDETQISVRGTASKATILGLVSTCLATGLLLQNSPPHADAGSDQAARVCSIVRLDGSRSIDPEGVAVTYNWRLINAPITSAYCFNGHDALTYPLPSPTGFTNKVYSVELQNEHGVDAFADGDVLLIGGQPYTILLFSVDGNGFYALLDVSEVPDDFTTGQPFKVLRQRGVSGANTAHPTFFPDVTGIYKFDLRVFDGSLYSSRVSTIVNVVESHIPRGCTPDVAFLWNYISDFWKLVEGTELIETFWGALAQLAASELLTLWQHEYSKSLRDIQRTHQRRWLHYDLFLREPLIEQTSIRTVFAGVQSITLDLSVTPTYGGQKLFVLMPDGQTTEIFLSQPANGPGGPIPTIQEYLTRVLRNLDVRFSVDLLITQDGLSGRLVVRAPFPFTFTESSTATSLFTFPAQNDLPRSIVGAPIGTNSYIVDRPLTGIDVQPGDYLVVGGVAYSIVRITSDATDAWENQRLVFAESLPVTAGSKWVICGATTSAFIDFYNSLCSEGDTAIYEVVQKSTGQLAYVEATVLSAAAGSTSSLLTEHAPIAAYLSEPDSFSVYFHSVYRRTYMPVDPLVVEVPTLQERIKNTDDKTVLRQNIDYFITEYRELPCLQFVTGKSPDPDVWEYLTPPQRMWAETTYIDNRPTIEQNFGIPAEFTLDDVEELDNNVDYLSCVRGLWYAYFNGPTLRNLRVGTQILLGLPFAEEAGTIVEINTEFSDTQGRILIQDTNEQAIVRSYTYPKVLSLETNPDTNERYAVGDTVPQFAPLVEGVEITDYIKTPDWFQKLLNQKVFSEVEKFFKFLVLVNSAAFHVETLPFTLSFIRRIKPTYTYPVSIVQKNEDITIPVVDEVVFSGGVNFIADLFYQGFGQIQSFDAQRPGGGYRSAFDTKDEFYIPTYPTPTIPTRWGFDNYLLAPRENLFATLSQVVSSPGVQSAGGPFYTGLPVFTEIVSVLSDGQTFWLPPSPGYTFASETVGVTATVNRIITYIRMDVNAGTAVTVKYYKNNVLAHTESITMPDLGTSLAPSFHTVSSAVSIGVVPGDILSATFEHGGTGLNTYVKGIWGVFGVAQTWESVSIGPGTFLMIRPM